MMNRQWKDTQDRLFHLKQSSRRIQTQATPSNLKGDTIALDLNLAVTSEIPPDMILELPSDDIVGKGRFGICKKISLQGVPACAKELNVSNSSTKLALLREASILFKIRHPNIVCVIGVQTVQKPFQLITLYYSINGISLSIYDTFTIAKLTDAKACALELVRPNLILDVWLAIMKDVASALAFIHSKSIIHRDLKSDNVVLNKQGDSVQCILIDFGKSSHIGKVQRYHLSDKEKEEYCCYHKQVAPDLVDGITNVSTASDMYSYGRLLKNIIQYFPLNVDLIGTSLKKAIKQCIKYNDFDRPSAMSLCEIFHS